ncbi:MAG TPA: ATPase [Firmicutes bacterium]|nr:ATPase [Bacillota bacterium]
MRIEEVLDLLDEMIDDAWSLPLSGGRCVLDAAKVRDLIDDIRANLPIELKQAKAIVADRNEIIEGARSEAAALMRKAEKKAQALIKEDVITKQAQAHANEMLSDAQHKSREMKQAANEYADSIMSKADECLTESLKEIRNARALLKNQQK